MPINSRNVSAARTGSLTQRSNVMPRVILCTLLIFTFTDWCSPTVIQVAPTEESLQGCWVGVPYQTSDYCRLVLTNGTGIFARIDQPEKPVVYRIETYKTDRQGRVSFRTSPASTNAYPIVITGTANSHQIRLTIKSPDGGWSHESVLYREETVNRRLQELKRVTEEFGF